MATDVWDEASWLPRREAHRARVDGWLVEHRTRRSRGGKHPVEDFLFEYYTFRPYQLRRWHPGHGVTLSGQAAEELLSWPGYVRVDQGVALDTAALVAARSNTIAWVHDLLLSTAGRPGNFGCFGLHEWAMVYRHAADQRRHAEWPLRLTPDRVAEVVDERGVRCTHFDAFRFFTPAARPLNLVQPTRASQPQLEQPGCLHANMDLYKHAYKLSPLVPSDLVADAFALARDIRALDMRASPYDLSALGLDPVPVETADGRVAYAQAQRTFSTRSVSLRQQLIEVLQPILTPNEEHPRSA
ncbi:MAG TPA: 3-methyladenine DNA glycosylase [Propionibacteriaceae bacterium]|nr:3-methyladenine DNA glycosylase [Propionibacteriaceae bacterium]